MTESIGNGAAPEPSEPSPETPAAERQADRMHTEPQVHHETLVRAPRNGPGRSAPALGVSAAACTIAALALGLTIGALLHRPAESRVILVREPVITPAPTIRLLPPPAAPVVQPTAPTPPPAVPTEVPPRTIPLPAAKPAPPAAPAPAPAPAVKPAPAAPTAPTAPQVTPPPVPAAALTPPAPPYELMGIAAQGQVDQAPDGAAWSAGSSKPVAVAIDGSGRIYVGYAYGGMALLEGEALHVTRVAPPGQPIGDVSFDLSTGRFRGTRLAVEPMGELAQASISQMPGLIDDWHSSGAR